jgi:hypothetical protein
MLRILVVLDVTLCGRVNRSRHSEGTIENLEICYIMKHPRRQNQEQKIYSIYMCMNVYLLEWYSTTC